MSCVDLLLKSKKSDREGAGGNVCAHFCLGYKLEEKGHEVLAITQWSCDEQNLEEFQCMSGFVQFRYEAVHEVLALHKLQCHHSLHESLVIISYHANRCTAQHLEMECH